MKAILQIGTLLAAAWTAGWLVAPGHDTVAVQSISQAINAPGGSYPSVPTGNLTSTASMTNASSNWAGYDLTGASISGVSGSWTVPDPSSSSYEAADATWIGIGGISSDDLIQVGTQNTVLPDGSVSASAFYEMLPDSEVPIPSLVIAPGDKITASLQAASPGEWTIRIADTTSGTSEVVPASYSSSESSAEWIEEDPSTNYLAQVPLDNFGSVNFSGTSAIENGRSVNLTSGQAQALSMIDEGGVGVVTVTQPSSGGTGFTATENSSNAPTVVRQFSGSYGRTRHRERSGAYWRGQMPGGSGYQTGTGYQNYSAPSGFGF